MMSSRIRYLLSCSLLMLAATALAAELPANMPKRKPGLWTMQISGMPAGKGGLPTMCLDAATDAAMYRMSGKMRGAMCSKLDISMHGGILITDSVCQMQMPTGAVNMVGHSETRFDGDTAYHTASTAKYQPALMGMNESSSTSEGHWVGPCKPGQKPGDMIMGNGMVMNIAQMMH